MSDNPRDAIGPLEEAHPQNGPLPLQLLESPKGLPRRTVVRLLVAFLLLASLLVYLTRPRPVPPVPTVYPAQSTTVTYRGTASAPADPSHRNAAFLLDALDTDAVAVTITHIASPYRGVTLRTLPALPLTVPPHQTVSIRIITVAFDCSRIPRNDELPFLDVTFRNTRAMEQESEILGDRFTSDLHRAMTMACHVS